MRKIRWISIALSLCLLLITCVTPASAVSNNVQVVSEAQRETHMKEHICNFLNGVDGYYVLDRLGNNRSVNEVKAAYMTIANKNTRSYSTQELTPENLDLDLYFQMLAATGTYHYSCIPTSVREITTNHYRAYLHIESIKVYKEANDSYFDTAISIDATCQVSFSISNGNRSIYAASAPDSYLYAMGFGGPEWEATYDPDIETATISGSQVRHKVHATVYYEGFVESGLGGGAFSLVYQNVGFDKYYNVNSIDLEDWGF